MNVKVIKNRFKKYNTNLKKIIENFISLKFRVINEKLRGGLKEKMIWKNYMSLI